MGHLILQRKPGEEIAIGDTIVVRVLSARGSRVRLAITAPETTSVHRMEIYKAIKAKDPSDDQSAA